MLAQLFAVMAPVLLAAGIWAGTRAATRLRAGSRLFAASLAEIAQDRETLRPKE